MILRASPPPEKLGSSLVARSEKQFWETVLPTPPLLSSHTPDPERRWRKPLTTYGARGMAGYFGGFFFFFSIPSLGYGAPGSRWGELTKTVEK